jgi:hypothetical protein
MTKTFSRRVSLALLLGFSALAAGCPPPPWAWHRHHGEDRYDRHDDRDERHHDRDERHHDRDERHDDRSERR